MIKISNIEEAAKAVAFHFQLSSIKSGKRPLEAFSSLGIELPRDFPDDWRACDFMSLVNLTEESKDE